MNSSEENSIVPERITHPSVRTDRVSSADSAPEAIPDHAHNIDTSTSEPPVGASREAGREFSSKEIPISPPRDTLTDADAEKCLPGYAIAFENYHQHRSGGASPSEALSQTLNDWRVFWNDVAYVPHRHHT